MMRSVPIRRLFVIGVSFGLVVATILIAVGTQPYAPVSSAETNPEILLNAPVLPDICAGESRTPEQAESESRYDVPMPHDENAERKNMSDLRRCGSDVFMMQFESGIRISVEENYFEDPEAAFKELDAGNEDITYGEVEGLPAAFIEPAEDPVNPADGSVIFVRDGVLVEVIGNSSLSLDELKRVAASLRSE
jgi:hypothetical protein